ncbi:hypothetical protein B7Y92_03050 [Candidatus Saccharibacteria bacterium 32-50-13]|nr:MAG: hypothetical protein B7Y92_03050 [Candidatus Saccharibacteria bacterium 32-50-13]
MAPATKIQRRRGMEIAPKIEAETAARWWVDQLRLAEWDLRQAIKYKNILSTAENHRQLDCLTSKKLEDYEVELSRAIDYHTQGRSYFMTIKVTDRPDLILRRAAEEVGILHALELLPRFTTMSIQPRDIRVAKGSTAGFQPIPLNR